MLRSTFPIKVIIILLTVILTFVGTDTCAQSCFNYQDSYSYLSTIPETTYTLDACLSGDLALLAGGADDDFTIASIADPKNPVDISSLAVGTGLAIAVYDNYVAYINRGQDQLDQLLIIDVSNPYNPQVLSTTSLMCSSEEINLVMDGEYVYYAASRHAGEFGHLRFINISNPLSPVIDFTTDIDGAYEDILVHGDYAYLSYGASSPIEVYDISDKSSPGYVTSLDLHGYELEMDDEGYLYSQDMYTLNIVDVSNPLITSIVEQVTIPDYNVVDMSISHDGVYLALYFNQIVFMEPYSDSEVAEFILCDLPSSPRFVCGGNDLFLTSFGYSNVSSAGCHVFRTSFLTAPPFVKVNVSESKCITASGDFVYLGTDQNLLVVYDTSDPLHPVELTRMLNPEWMRPKAMELEGNVLFIATGEGMISLDVSAPSAPAELDTLLYPYGIDLLLDGGYAYVSSDGISVVDVSNPSSMQEVTVHVPSIDMGDLARCEDYLYATSFQQLSIFSINEPGSLSYKKSFPDSDVRTWSDIFIVDGFAYVSGSEFLKIYDLTYPLFPQFVGSIETAYYVESIYIDGSYAYLAESGMGLHIIDLHDKTNPVNIAGHFLQAEVCDLVLNNGLLFIADNGLVIAPTQCDPLSFAIEKMPRGQTTITCSPNPFNPRTEISFSVDEFEPVNLSIYDLSGRLIKTLVDTHLSAGQKTVVWNGTNSSGKRVASGTYFLRLETDQGVRTRKVMLTK
jgi:hypothetical protein